MPTPDTNQQPQSPAEQKTAEEVLRQIQLVVDHSNDAIIGETLDGVITSWNGGATRMFGYSAQEVIGKSVLFFVPPEHQDDVSDVLKMLKAGEFVVDHDSVRLHKNGSRIDVAFSNSPIKDEHGTLIGISCVERNITKRKEAEEVLRQIQLIVEDSHDAIIGETLGGMVTSWNGGATKMFGYSAEEIIGRPMTKLFPPELKDELPNLLNKVGRGEVIADYDSIWIRKDKTHADVEFSLSPVYAVVESLSPTQNTQGKIIGASLVGRDISERKKSEQHVKELNETRNKFIAIVSHQLRTPLTSVNWNLETLLNGDLGKLEDTQQKFVQATHSASVEITQRIHYLLTAMDVEEGRVKYESEEVALDNLCAGVVNEMQKKCELKKLSCEYTPPLGELPTFEGDGEKIRSVINVLLENAINYTKENGKITVKLEQKGNLIVCEVADTGVGIPQTEQHNIGNRFFRASNASIMEPDAFGLGLFIAKSFIEQHHGKIGFESKEGVGSKFWFEIPLKNEIASE